MPLSPVIPQPKFVGEFDTLEDRLCRLEIYQKGWSGSTTILTMGGTPILHSYSGSGLFDAIKGSQLRIQLVDIGIEEFVSDSDFDFEVRYYFQGQLKFIGHLMQDDYKEEIAEYRHYIELTATDSIGVLKDKTLDENIHRVKSVQRQSDITFISQKTIRIAAEIVADLQFGDKIVMWDFSMLTGEFEYTITEVVPGAGFTDILIEEVLMWNGLNSNINYHFLLKPDIFELNTIGDYITMCLSVIELQLPIRSYNSLREEGKADIYQTKIDGKSFLKNETDFDSCYNVLQNILSAMQMTLFQKDGRWNLIRWGEADTITSKTYQWGFANPVAGGAIRELNDLLAIAGAEKSIERPIKRTLLTFNYKQPKNIIRNLNLLETGKLISETTQVVDSETQIVKTYAAKHWKQYDSRWKAYPPLIVVVFDALDNEIDRYLFVRRPGVGTKQIMINRDDEFSLSFNFQTTKTADGPSATPFGLLIEGKNGRKAILSNMNEKMWDENVYGDLYQSSRWSHRWLAGENASRGIAVEINNSNAPIPFDGRFTFTIAAGGDNSDVWGQHRFRDFRFDYIYKVNRTTQIIGQVNKQETPANLINQIDEEIFIDQSPRYQISGALYSDFETLATRFVTNAFPVAERFGDIITDEQTLLRTESNLELEGEFLTECEMCDLIKYNENLFAPVYLERDVRKHKINAKFTQVKKREAETTYKLDYIYDTKR